MFELLISKTIIKLFIKCFCSYYLFRIYHLNFLIRSEDFPELKINTPQSVDIQKMLPLAHRHDENLMEEIDIPYYGVNVS